MNKFSKITTKKAFTLFLSLIVLASVMLLSSCGSEPLVIKDSDTCIVIKTTEESIGADTEMVLIDYMASLKEKGELEYSLTDGMLTSINGKDNTADFSTCWMLYTSDPDNSNAAWGTVEYEGNEYGSAIVGAEVLKLKPDHYYIWVYKSFN